MLFRSNWILLFFSFPYKLNCLDFCCYFFSEIMSIFFILFLFKYFVCKDIERDIYIYRKRQSLEKI